MTNIRPQKSEAGRQTRLSLFALVCLLSSVICLLLFLIPAPAPAASWDAEAVIKTYLRDHYPWGEIELTDLRFSGDLPVSGPVAIVVEKTPPGRSVFRFDFKNGQSITVTALVKAYDRVLMSRSGFRKGHVLQADDLYPTLLETARIPKGAVRVDDRIIGRPLLRSVVPNAVITEMMVSDSSAVKRGRRVVLSIEAPGFSIRTAGEMKHDAQVGDPVKVVNLLSKKIVAGILVYDNTVRVGF
jgi:flagella basal body P-ring formation protein FlgA